MLAASPSAYGPNLLSRLLAARTLQQIDDCAKSAWILNGAGLVGDNEMEYLAPIIEHQRKAIRMDRRSGRWFRVHAALRVSGQGLWGLRYPDFRHRRHGHAQRVALLADRRLQAAGERGEMRGMQTNR